MNDFCCSITVMAKRRKSLPHGAQSGIEETIRLHSPARSRSRLLEMGRSAYRNADEGSLAMLQGLEVVPVQRNQGIDAILKEEFEGGPVPIRIQRAGETLLEAAQKLAKASAGKGARIMFVVAISRGGCFDFADELPAGVIAVASPALSIREQLSEGITARRGNFLKLNVSDGFH